MPGLSFQYQKPINNVSPQRMDVACFVGLIDVRVEVDNPDINRWLNQQSWLNYNGHTATYHRETAVQLRDVPIPIESWQQFEQMFQWNQRTLLEGITGVCYLASAVHSFFAQGGRFCYVIAMGSPLTLDAPRNERETLLASIIPGYPGVISSNPFDRINWHGIGHVLGLPDVTLLSLPDLPDLVSSEQINLDIDLPVIDTDSNEQFVICSVPVIPAPVDNLSQSIPAPTCDLEGYGKWANSIHQLAQFISRHRRDIQLVASIPLADEGSLGSSDLLKLMHQQGWLNNDLDSPSSISSSFVQLCYPWINTSQSSALAQGVEPPEGALCGLLARNAISRGAYRAVTELAQNDIKGIYPELSRAQRQSLYPGSADTASPKAALIERVSLFGYGTEGIDLLSDVTTSNQTAHRPANINRIITMVIRSSRHLGEEYTFETNGERLWALITQRLNALLRLLFDLGALRGKNPTDAFNVTCDRNTMTQQDLDSGRVIVQIQFNPASSIESIEVLLQMQQSAATSISAPNKEQAVA